MNPIRSTTRPEHEHRLAEHQPLRDQAPVAAVGAVRCCRPGTGSGPAGRSTSARRSRPPRLQQGVVHVAEELQPATVTLPRRPDAGAGVHVVVRRSTPSARRLAVRRLGRRRVVGLGARSRSACRPPTPSAGSPRWRTAACTCRPDLGRVLGEQLRLVGRAGADSEEAAPAVVEHGLEAVAALRQLEHDGTSDGVAELGRRIPGSGRGPSSGLASSRSPGCRASRCTTGGR